MVKFYTQRHVVMVDRERSLCVIAEKRYKNLARKLFEDKNNRNLEFEIFYDLIRNDIAIKFTINNEIKLEYDASINAHKLVPDTRFLSSYFRGIVYIFDADVVVVNERKDIAYFMIDNIIMRGTDKELNKFLYDKQYQDFIINGLRELSKRVKVLHWDNVKLYRTDLFGYIHSGRNVVTVFVNEGKIFAGPAIKNGYIGMYVWDGKKVKFEKVMAAVSDHWTISATGQNIIVTLGDDEGKFNLLTGKIIKAPKKAPRKVEKVIRKLRYTPAPADVEKLIEYVNRNGDLYAPTVTVRKVETLNAYVVVSSRGKMFVTKETSKIPFIKNIANFIINGYVAPEIKNILNGEKEITFYGYANMIEKAPQAPQGRWDMYININGKIIGFDYFDENGFKINGDKIILTLGNTLLVHLKEDVRISISFDKKSQLYMIEHGLPADYFDTLFKKFKVMDLDKKLIMIGDDKIFIPTLKIRDETLIIDRVPFSDGIYTITVPLWKEVDLSVMDIDELPEYVKKMKIMKWGHFDGLRKVASFRKTHALLFFDDAILRIIHKDKKQKVSIIKAIRGNDMGEEKPATVDYFNDVRNSVINYMAHELQYEEIFTDDDRYKIIKEGENAFIEIVRAAINKGYGVDVAAVF